MLARVALAAFALACTAGALAWSAGGSPAPVGPGPRVVQRSTALASESLRAPESRSDMGTPTGAPAARIGVPPPNRATLAIRVRDAHGAALPGACVELTRGERPCASARADALGAVDLGPLEPGPYGLRLVGESLPDDQLAPRRTWLRLGPGERRELDLHCVARIRVSGRVLDPRGEPVADVRLRAVPAAIDPLARAVEVRSDADGRFELAGLRAGACELSLELPGPVLERRWAVPDVRALQLDGWDLTGLVLVLEPARASVSGRLVDLDGAAAVGWTVVGGAARAVTDGSGCFTLDGLTREPLVLRVAAARPRGGPLGSRRGALGPERDVELVELPAEVGEGGGDLGVLRVAWSDRAPR